MQIKLTDYIDTLQTSIEALPSVRDVYVFGGKPTEDDLKRVKLQPNSMSVLLTAGGGQLVPSNNPNAIDSEVIFAAYIIGPAKRQGKSMGFSPELVDNAQQIMGLIKNLKFNAAVQQTQLLPEFLEWGEMANPIQNSVSHACWYIVWQQRLTLNVNPL